MKPILTITLNPTIDASCEAEEVRPVFKIRTTAERYDPGGGGINVARVVRELGGDAVIVCLAGGVNGQVLIAMLDRLGLERQVIPIAGNTRISFVVHERASGQEYRFVAEGPEIRADEWRACLARLDSFDADYVVASGSLPRGIPHDFYARVAHRVAGRGGRLVLDTSGEALRAALAEGVYLVKPNLRELESLVGQKLEAPREQEEAARRLVAHGAAELVAVSLGADGALLATRDGCIRLAAPPVEPKSAVGAGDSFVAAMTLALAQGRPPADAFALGVAAGTAAVLTMGTELCRRGDVERIYRTLPPPVAGAR